ncbi:HmuY family protein [Flavobacterium sp.]|uniref:HmuY family protein n=1 Tax=Flavobacterium sp. TaxID=239 RepID=UPI0026271883|nr:HmuY family protein [Flavobacterium sp.]
MKTNFFKFSILALTIVLSSCNNDDDAPVQPTLETKTVVNLAAPQTGGQGQPVGGAFTKFSFSENAIVTNDNWDIAFRGTTIIVNGGDEIGIADEPTRTGTGAVSIVSNTFSAVTAFPETSTFKQDGSAVYAIPTGSGNGWYSYNQTTNIISPIAGKVFVVKTHNGKYAKFEILSYYKDAPATPDATSLSRYFTFKFVYQNNSTTTF